MKYVIGLFITSLIVSSLSFAGSGLSLQGRILKADGSPVTAPVTFKIQIRSPGTEDCLLYEELQAVDLSSTQGAFSLTIGSGTRSASSVDGGNSLERIFANRGTLDFSSTSPAACAVGSSYTIDNPNHH
jgi:hypothetical protein